ncbi:GtrA family protein [Brucella gallinifaecis]|uniref:GtrA family protein n=1 Tax=Brucella gallinifaecis TaxID=215590 RepID=UPI00363C8120
MYQCSLAARGAIILISQLIKYGIVGILNTVLTFLVIAVLTTLDINPYLSNTVGFGAGLLNSYLLNSHFTFRQKSSGGSLTRFGAAFSIAYVLNLVVLYYLIHLAIVPMIMAQLIAMITYNLTFFILMKTWVFGHDDK